MSLQNTPKKEGMRYALTALPVAAATLGLAGLLLLSLFKNDIAAWVFVAIFTAIGCAACVFFLLKTINLYGETKTTGYPAKERPLGGFVLAAAETAVTVLASLVILIVTLCKFAA